MKNTTKKIISAIIATIMLCTMTSFTAFASAINTAQTAKTVSVGSPVTQTFKCGYPDGTYNSYINENEVYYKFVPTADGYYEFNVTGYEDTEYATGKTADVWVTVNDSDSKYICSAYTDEITLITRKAGYCYKGETYYIDLSDYLYNIASYSDNQYGYAEQTLQLSVTKHKHDYSVESYDYTDYSYAYYNCKYCDDYYSGTFYKPTTLTLSKTSYVYDGKAKKPTVTVKDSNGKKISSSYYTVTYSKGRKNVGKYTVTVKFKKEYSRFGSLKKTFTIKPKATTVSKVTAKKKGFTIKWKKQATQTTGYQIQYSTSSKFKSAKTVTVKGSKNTSKTVKNLKAKKKYYVRVRTYKTVDGKKYYSSWSKSKTVTTKK